MNVSNTVDYVVIKDRIKLSCVQNTKLEGDTICTGLILKHKGDTDVKKLWTDQEADSE